MRKAELHQASKMNLHSEVFLSCLLLCGVATVLCESTDGQCTSLVNGPFDICTKAGYNDTLPFPKALTEQLKTELAVFLPRVIKPWLNCSSWSLAATMECSFFFPKCSTGKRVLPCRRVCGELLKQCMNQVGNDRREIFMNFLLAECMLLPNEKASSDKCFEPPNFTTNDSVPSKFFIMLYPCLISRTAVNRVCRRKILIYGRGGGG